jgi:RNA polymerase sigma-70 factor (ECF subfamily)
MDAPNPNAPLPSGLDVLAITWMPMLRRYCAAIAGHPQDAEDIAQETLLEAQRSFHRFTRGTDFGAWLRGIARNVFSRHRRRMARQTRVTVALEPAVLDQLETLYREEDLSDDAAVDVLQRCIRKLPPVDRDLVTARYERGLSVEAVCQETGRTASWVKTRLMRARWWLQGCVQRGLRQTTGAGEVAP